MSSDNDIVLSVKNVSKCFEMYEKPVHRLYQTLCAGKKQFYKEFWALKDISFDVRRGECVGIIGRNGAGKSTLLQIITGTLAPTSGEVKVNGRIAALLELGSGFNPEFTGRENVYLNGAILGLSKEEIDRRYDDILAFADIGDFIDQPVKTYSSGMMVRLAFAVQVMVDPDVLVVDEALAVGDAAFQMKCMAHMRSLLNGGVAILLVTHDVSTVRSFCSKAVWIRNGALVKVGDTQSTTTGFLEEMFSSDNGIVRHDTAVPSDYAHVEEESKPSGMVCVDEKTGMRRWGTGEARIAAFSMGPSSREVIVPHDEMVRLTVHVAIGDMDLNDEITASFSIRNRNALDIQAYVGYSVAIRGDAAARSVYSFEYEWRNCLIPGEYELVLAVERLHPQSPDARYLDFVEHAAKIVSTSVVPLYGMTAPFCKSKCQRLK